MSRRHVAEVVSVEETCWRVGVEVIGSRVSASGLGVSVIGLVGGSFESFVERGNLALDLLELLRESAHVIRACRALKGCFSAIALGLQALQSRE
ncbi:MAG TPA: hypothetical protein ENJ18_04685 [Nannocystis exedens]|nr:hypothetical protein [Nannocystis exedens]